MESVYDAYSYDAPVVCFYKSNIYASSTIKNSMEWNALIVFITISYCY